MNDRSKTLSWGVLCLSLLLALLTGCIEDGDSPSVEASAACQEGEVIEYEDTSYCILIEEGFLTSDCPEEFPQGEDFNGAIVCAKSDAEIPDDLREELEERGWVDTGDCQCPDVSRPDVICEFGALIEFYTTTSCDEDNQCVLGQETVSTRCSDNGQVCRNNACVDPEPSDCFDNNECPQPDAPAPVCEGNTVVEYPGDTGICSENNLCITVAVPGQPNRTDCGDGLVCREGACVQGDGATCETSADCPDTDIRPTAECDGNTLIEDTTSGGYICTEENICELQLSPGAQLVTECDEQGLVCRDGACVEDTRDACNEDDDCPIPPGLPPRCEGNTVVYTYTNTSCGEDNTCAYDTTTETEACVEGQQVCQEGMCVDSGPDECRSNDECPQPDAPAPFCDGNTVVTASPVGYCNQDNMCQIDSNEMRTECVEGQQICRDGMCVGSNPAECREDDDCPIPPGLPPRCEGNTVVSEITTTSCSDDNTCAYETTVETEECAEGQQVCQEGACVDLGPGECRSNDECPQPDAPAPFCDGNTVVTASPVGYCNQDNMCQIDSNEMRTECAEGQQICRDGMCIPR